METRIAVGGDGSRRLGRSVGLHPVALLLAAGIALLASIAGGTLVTQQMTRTREDILRTLHTMDEDSRGVVSRGKGPLL
jgi:hypothetical protein